MNNSILESLYCGVLACFGWIMHTISPGDSIIFQWLHEILQDGAWLAAIILGIKAVIDFLKKRKNK